MGKSYHMLQTYSSNRHLSWKVASCNSFKRDASLNTYALQGVCIKTVNACTAIVCIDVYVQANIHKYTDINVCARTPRMHHLFPYRITYLANMKNASESVKLSSFKCFSKSSIDDPEIMHLRVASFPPAPKKKITVCFEEKPGVERFTRKIPTQLSWKQRQNFVLHVQEGILDKQLVVVFPISVEFGLAGWILVEFWGSPKWKESPMKARGFSSAGFI